MNVTDFPTAEARASTARQRLARYLRELASVIERDEAATEPTAALIVISGPRQHEVLCCGYGNDAGGLMEAAQVGEHCTRPWRTLGRNVRPRHAYQPAPTKDGNVVDGAFPQTLLEPTDA